jgi:hypothetical protein
MAALLVATAGCGSSSTPKPPGITVSSLTLSFSSPAAQNFTVSEPGYTGTFTATSSDTNVVTVAPAASAVSTQQSHRRPQAHDTRETFTVTPINGGAAAITVSDGAGRSTSVSVSVTGVTFTPQLHR